MLEWWKQTSWFIKAATGVLAFLTATGAAAKTWVEFDFFVPASQRFVLAQVESVQSPIRDLQIDIAQGKRDQAADSLTKWGIELNKTNDPTTKRLIQGQVDELQSTIDKLNSQIQTLRILRR